MDSSGVRATLGAARACRSHALAWHALLVRAPPQQALHARARHGTPPPLPPPLPPPPSKHTATPEVGAHGPALDAADVGAAHRAVHLCQRLLELAVAGRHLGVADEARQQVHAVHGWVARQRLGQLDDVLDLAACACVLAAWRGVAWRGVAWRGVAWRGVAWRGVAWRGVAWRGVAWRGVAWRGVAWRGAVEVVCMWACGHVGCRQGHTHAACHLRPPANHPPPRTTQPRGGAPARPCRGPCPAPSPRRAPARAC
jgi:hypothetical protein